MEMESGSEKEETILEEIKAILDEVDNALASIGTDKFRVSIVDSIPESDINLVKIAGTSLTGRDWSSDFAKLQNLDALLSTRASESTLTDVKNLLDKLEDALASVGTDKFRSTIIDALPSGTNTIGKVNIEREGSVTHFSVAATAAGSTTIYTPATGKAAKVLGWSFYSDADVVVELRFATSGNVIAGLPFKGAHAMNCLGLTAPQGSADEVIEIYVSGAVNVKGWICVEEV